MLCIINSISHVETPKRSTLVAAVSVTGPETMEVWGEGNGSQGNGTG